MAFGNEHCFSPTSCLSIFQEIQSFAHPHFPGRVAKNQYPVVIPGAQFFRKGGSENSTYVHPGRTFIFWHSPYEIPGSIPYS